MFSPGLSVQPGLGIGPAPCALCRSQGARAAAGDAAIPDIGTPRLILADLLSLRRKAPLPPAAIPGGAPARCPRVPPVSISLAHRCCPPHPAPCRPRPPAGDITPVFADTADGSRGASCHGLRIADRPAKGIRQADRPDGYVRCALLAAPGVSARPGQSGAPTGSGSRSPRPERNCRRTGAAAKPEPPSGGPRPRPPPLAVRRFPQPGRRDRAGRQTPAAG